MILLLLGINMALGQTNGYCNLVWSDEFNGPTVSSDWTKEATCYGGGNNELECYTPRDKNIYIENGALVLHAYPETYTGSQQGCTDSQGCTWTKPYTSGRVNTAATKSFTYGRFEIRAQLPSGTHLWPAIWMLPTDYSYGGWAASGEIDIMESRGDHPNLISGTLHHGGAWPNNVWTTSGDHGNGADLSQDFHVYALEWTATSLTWFLDGVTFQSYDTQRWWNTTTNGPYWAKGQPWDRRFHFILNLAVGGGFFGGYPDLQLSQAYAWANPTMKVDYVRAWSQGGNCGAAPAASTTTSQAQQSTPTQTQAADQGNRPAAGTCNGAGYDSSAYTCTINEAGKYQLCAIGQSSCGQACYNPATYCCSNGLQPKSSAVCANANVVRTSTSTSASTSATSASSSSTRTSASSSTTQTSASSSTTRTSAATPATSAASSTPGLCNGQSYGQGYVCTINNLGLYQLCSAATPLGCSGACYNGNNYCCKNGRLNPVGQC